MSGDRANGWEDVSDLNFGYLAELFERYAADPQTVDSGTRAFFERYGPPPLGAPEPVPAPAGSAPTATAPLCEAIALSTAIRTYGYRAARLDPLGSTPSGDAALQPQTYGIRQNDLAVLPGSVAGGPLSAGQPNALSAVEALRAVYQDTSGFEFEHVSNAEEREWLRYAVESGAFRPPRQRIDERRLLERLTQVEAFERFLHTAFPTQTRFSIEGLDMLVPMLDDVVGAAAEEGTRVVTVGIAHRGRLNVLAHVLGKPYEQIIAEFQGSAQRPNVSPSGSGGAGWTGDVKYHLAARKAIKGGREVAMVVSLLPNPSHLEFIDPVAEGVTRAGSERRDAAGPAKLDEMAALAVLVHGEAAFVGEGIVAETLNLSRLPGYRSGGTVHIIANNQVGFTTPPESGRSTLFASDLAKGFEIPVVHVNADDPEACIAAVRLAHAYVDRFRKDVVVDLIGYRRWGHNEGDEPSFTEPVMYKAIGQHPPVRELWSQEMARRGLIRQAEAQEMLREATEHLYAIRRGLPQDSGRPDEDRAGREAGGVHGGLGRTGVAAEIATAVPAGDLARLNEEVLRFPDGFNLHPKLQPFYARRRGALSDQAGRIDWGHAEVLALASILSDGTPIRLTGQDTARGTFGQRHAVLHDAQNGRAYVPLQNIPSARASFEVWDSPLSEQATMGFEFGYNIQAPEALVVWEAQYGDFVNAAQVIMDEFVVSARLKWGLRPSLVLMLPHGYEGQGPDHSSARIERFLQMAAEDNLRIANCTSAAQYFHILRRQAKLVQLDPRPLILLTPKSLLRNPLAATTLNELATGRFQPVIDDLQARQAANVVRRAVFCTGHVYVDLVAARAKESVANVAQQVAIVRLEELYPFPAGEIRDVIGNYPKIEEVVWVQEEPRNMGGWTYVAPRLRDILEDRLPLTYVGRTRRASPAEGSHEWYVREQARLVEDALRPRAYVRQQQQ